MQVFIAESKNIYFNNNRRVAAEQKDLGKYRSDAVKMMLISFFYFLIPLLYIPLIDCGAADIVFVIDASGSINEQNEGNWNLLLDFVVQVVSDSRFPIGRGANQFQFGVVVYSTIARVEFVLDRYTSLSDLVSAIRRINYDRDRTNIAQGLQVAREQIFLSSNGGNRPGIRDVLILLTDGIPNEREDDTIPQATITKSASIFIMSVGITSSVNEAELRQISSADDVLAIDDFAALDDNSGRLAQSTCEAGKCIPKMILLRLFGSVRIRLYLIVIQYRTWNDNEQETEGALDKRRKKTTRETQDWRRLSREEEKKRSNKTYGSVQTYLCSRFRFDRIVIQILTMSLVSHEALQPDANLLG